MPQSSFEHFQQRIFDESDELERRDRERLVDKFVELGRRFRINVVSEILDNGKSDSEVFDAILREQSKS